MNMIPVGTKVRHRDRKGVYAAITGHFYSGHDGGLYYNVDVYTTDGVLKRKNGNWMAENCIPITGLKNASVKNLLEADY